MKRFAMVALAAWISQGLLMAQTAPAQQSGGTPQGATGSRPAAGTGQQGAGGPTAKATTGKAAIPPARTTSVRVSVHDPNGESLDGVRLILSGSAEGEYSTAAAGTAVLTNIKDGTYRIRCERDGFITLEREFPVHNAGALTPVDVVLTPAPPPPPPPPAPKPAAPVAGAAAGPPVNVNIPDFLDTNFIGRDPMRESVLACKPAETVRLLQLRDGLAEHVHDKVDEILYVVAGDGAVRVGNQTMAVKAGSLAVVPQGVAHAIERRGKNPLVVVSTLSGAPCQTGTQVSQ
jgi:mannose-6-phosphate isomerase-like protein (cupin superfamily)